MDIPQLVSGPLTKFQAKIADRDGTRDLVRTLNQAAKETLNQAAKDETLPDDAVLRMAFMAFVLEESDLSIV